MIWKLLPIAIVAFLLGSPTALAEVPGPISAIGCSNTRDAIQGYLKESVEDRFVNTGQGGQTMTKWELNSNSVPPWSNYLALRPSSGFEAAWINMCARVNEPTMTEQQINTIIARIHVIDPGIPIYLSPLNFYVTESCVVTGGNTISNQGDVLADTMAGASSTDLLLRGPDLGPLALSQLVADFCHPNKPGKALLGGQLVSYFD